MNHNDKTISKIELMNALEMINSAKKQARAIAISWLKAVSPDDLVGSYAIENIGFTDETMHFNIVWYCKGSCDMEEREMPMSIALAPNYQELIDQHKAMLDEEKLLKEQEQARLDAIQKIEDERIEKENRRALFETLRKEFPEQDHE